MPSSFADAARDLGFDFDAATLERFRIYRDHIAEAARRFNLTAVRDPAAIERRHFLESLAFGRVLHRRGLLPGATRLLDLGSGAGLPGLPLKLAWPQLRLTLNDSNAKRCAFLQDVVAELGLTDADVLLGRAEDLARGPHRAAYDLVVARAVASLPTILEYALPFLRVGGHLAALKGSGADDETKASQAALEALGGKVEAVESFRPPDGLPQSIVIIQKTAETPERYPRRAGLPSKRPIA
jgi:16S rRNA (guanine527-N7)-methyltransferase